MAIKTIKWNRGIEINYYEEIRHDNIVNILDIFIKDQQLYIVYEQIDVSLRLINSLPGGGWEPFEIVAICKEVCINLKVVRSRTRLITTIGS